MLVGPDFQRPESQHVAQNAGQALARQEDADIVARKFSILPVYAPLDQTGEPAGDQKRHEAAPEAHVVANVRQERYEAEPERLDRKEEHYLCFDPHPTVLEDCEEQRPEKE